MTRQRAPIQDMKMENLKALLKRFKAKKVSSMAVILVAIASGVAGAFAATIVVNTSSYNFSSEAGTLHQSSGAISATDNGFSVAINAFTNNQSNTLTLAAGNWQVQNTITKGDWIDSVAFTCPATCASGSHVTTIKVQNGGGTVAGTTIVTFTSGTWTTSSSSTGTVTCYVDTGLTSITSPLTIYVNVT